MKTNEIRAALDTVSQPFQKSHLNKSSFARCNKGSTAPGAPRSEAVYLVRDSMAIHNDERGSTSFIYKLDGFEGGIKSEKGFDCGLFVRWIPAVGDLVTLGTNPAPLVVSDIKDGDRMSDPLKLEFHRYSVEQKRWTYLGGDRGEDVQPVLGVRLNPAVVKQIRACRDARVAEFIDDTFTPPTTQEIPVDEDLNLVTKGDQAREVRIKNLRTNYRVALEQAILAGDQFLAQMGSPMEGYREIRQIGEKLSFVKPIIKR